MKTQHARFKFKTVNDLLKKAQDVGVSLPFQESIDILFEPVKVGSKQVANRFVVHPMEGFDSTSDGAPTDLTFRRYRRYAEGGSGLIWCEATSVVPEGRSNPGQLWIHSKNAVDFKRLVEQTRNSAYKKYGSARDIMLILQLTHSGRYSKPVGKPNPIIAHHSTVLDPIHDLPSDYPLISDEELDTLQEKFVAAARLAAEAGFDGVDIKACHRYLVSELLASFTREESRYGGEFENRIRFLVETARKIRSAVPDIFVSSRLNLYDAIEYPYGFGVDQNDKSKPDLSEPIALIKKLTEISYPVLNVSIGNPYFNPHVGRPYDFPVAGMQSPNEHPLVGISRIISITGEIQKAFPQLPVIGTGYSWLRHYFPHVAAAAVESGNATLIGQGRGAFAYPDSVNDLAQTGQMDPHKVCITCSACTQIMRDGGRTGCVVRDSEIYGAEYRRVRKTAADVLKKEAERCRDCDSPMCQLACPANLDIPGFIKAYGKGDISKAYSILLENNIFPEMCALICPVEVQCKGACVENIFSRNPVAISEIQLAIAKQARTQGLAKIAIPKLPSGRKVAIVGAGPAGMSCAAKLLQFGHQVEIFEKASTLGGIPGTVIPFERIDSQIVLNEVDSLFINAKKMQRLIIHTDYPLNNKNNIESIRQKFDAVFLGFGLSVSMKLPGVASSPKGVVDALSYLKAVKSKRNIETGKTVAVLGGGNTAIDAAITAKEQGAQDVYIVYRRSFNEMPAWQKDRDAAMEKSIHFLILSQPLDYIERNGALAGLKIIRTQLGAPDESGRRRPEIIPGSEYVLTVEQVIEAIGQRIDEDTKEALGVIGLNRNGWIKVDACYRTSLADVFAGGDVINGGATAVQAVADGMKAAVEIHRVLT